MNKITQYFKESYFELSKVTWPTKNQAIRLTGIVLGFCMVTAAFIGLTDALFSELYAYVLGLGGVL